MAAINSNRASAALFVILLTAIFILLFCICAELYHGVTLRTYVEDELSRGLRTAVGLSMRDEFRRDNISRIDAEMAVLELEKYLRDVMLLDDKGCRLADSRLVYRLIIQHMEIVAEPPAVTLEGVIEKKPCF